MEGIIILGVLELAPFSSYYVTTPTMAVIVIERASKQNKKPSLIITLTTCCFNFKTLRSYFFKIKLFD